MARHSSCPHSGSTPTQGTCNESGGTVTCDLGGLASGVSTTVAIQVTVSSSASSAVINAASVTSDETDPVLANNTSTATTTVELKADLEVTANAFPNPVVVNNDVTYTVVVANNGPSDSTGVILTTTLSAYVTFLSASSTQGGCVESGGTVTCNLGELPSGDTADAYIRVTVDPAQDFSSNPPKDTDGRGEESGRGVRELQGK